MVEVQTFGDWLKARRQEQDLTREALAKRVGCAVVTISKIEHGQRRPSREIALLIATALGLSADAQEPLVLWARGLAPPGAPAVADSPAPVVERPPGYLPASVTSFVGRATELAQVRALLWRTDVRLLTLTGPPGVGKTRLSLTVAAALSDDFEHGIWFVPLAPIRDPALVPAAIAQALGLPERGSRSTAETLRDYLRDKQLLLLLDNFEQILAAGPGLADLLAQAPRLKILVTSRAALHLYGEYEYLVPPLALPPLLDLPPEQLEATPAVALFVARATAANPHFRLTAANASLVAQLCVRLEGLPLALELAAARSKYLSPQALVRQMARQLPLLVGGPEDRPARQQTLRSAIAWSYELLPATAQTLFRGLGVFSGGGELAEIAAVLGADDTVAVAALLDHLLDHSLLRGEERGDRLRYTMLEAIREYASEQLGQAGEAAAVQRRHAWTYLALAEVLEPRLQGPDQAAALARLDQEYPNLRAALAWALDAGEAELAQRLAAAPWRYWGLRGLGSEGRAWLARVRAAAPERTLGWAAAARVAGVLAQAQADYAESRALLEAALAIYQAAGDTPHIAQVLNNLGLTVLEEGDVAAARVYFTASLTQHRAGGTLWGEAVALANLGMLAAEEQDWAATEPLLTAALQIFQRLGDERSARIVRNNLGSQAYQQGQYAEAQRIWTECLACQEALDDHEGRAMSFSNLAMVARDLGDWATAEAYIAAALTTSQELGDRRRIAYTLIHAAGLAVCQGQPHRAARRYGAAATLQATLGFALPAVIQQDRDRYSAQAEASLGAAEFAAQWQVGAAWPLAAALAEAVAPASAAAP